MALSSFDKTAFRSTFPPVFLHCCLASVQPLLEETTFQQALDLLPENGLWARRKEKIHRLSQPMDRCLCLAAGLLARRAFLKMELPLSLLSKEPNGKPSIKDGQHFFNLSHSGTYAVCVYGTSPCGIDIQKAVPDRFHVAERCFTKREQTLIREQGAELFSRIWAVKESYLKYTGEGIRVSLSSFEVSPGTLQTIPAVWKVSSQFLPDTQNTAPVEIHSSSETMLLSMDPQRGPVGIPLPLSIHEFTLEGYFISLCSREPMKESLEILSIEDLLYLK